MAVRGRRNVEMFLSPRCGRNTKADKPNAQYNKPKYKRAMTGEKANQNKRTSAANGKERERKAKKECRKILLFVITRASGFPFEPRSEQSIPMLKGLSFVSLFRCEWIGYKRRGRGIIHFRTESLVDRGCLPEIDAARVCRAGEEQDG